MLPRFPPSLLAPVLISAGVAWLVLGVSSVRVGALGVTRFQATRILGDRFPKTLVNPDGRKQALRVPPARIVSLVLGADEILTRTTEPSRVVAVSRFADNPALSTCADRIPPHAERIRGVDPENIIALRPDMVFVASFTLESAVRILVGAGIPVVRLREYRSFDDVIENVRLVAAAVGNEARAEDLVSIMNRRLEGISERVAHRARPRVLYYSAVGYTSGDGTLVHEKIVRAGGRNVVAEAGLSGPRHLSVDLLVALDPDVIVVPRWSSGDASVREVTDSPIWQKAAAIREGRVYGIDAKWLTSVSPDGVRGVEELARLFHPEAFTS